MVIENVEFQLKVLSAALAGCTQGQTENGADTVRRWDLCVLIKTEPAGYGEIVSEYYSKPKHDQLEKSELFCSLLHSLMDTRPPGKMASVS